MSIWSEEDIEILKKEYGKTRVSDLAVRFNRSTQTIIAKANKLGLYSKLKSRTQKQPLYLISEEKEKAVLIYKVLNKMKKHAIKTGLKANVNLNEFKDAFLVLRGERSN